ncbi:MAG: hypothetical protein ACREIA_04775 [Opitutaceae bacterium]
MNVSTRGFVSPGRPMIVGFVVPEPADPLVPSRREVLIRAVGPSLIPLGVENAWADPDFQVVSLGSAPSSAPNLYGDWTTLRYLNGTSLTTEPNPGGQAAFEKLFSEVGAFPLVAGSKDAVDVQRLAPGAYTVIAAAAAGDAGGDVLVEVYFLP